MAVSFWLCACEELMPCYYDYDLDYDLDLNLDCFVVLSLKDKFVLSVIDDRFVLDAEIVA